jgi:hypothetical protein
MNRVAIALPALVALSGCGGNYLSTVERSATPTQSSGTGGVDAEFHDDVRDSMTPLPPGYDQLPTPGPIADGLRRSGAHDLACPPDRLTLRSVHLFREEAFTAEGCGQRVTYLVEKWDKSLEPGGVNWLVHFVLIARVTLTPPASR